MIKKIKYITFILVLALAMASCEKFLEEEPKSSLTADYLEQADGVEAALNSAYSILRTFYGTEAGANFTVGGTDEWQRGPDGNTAFNLYDAGLSTHGHINNVWAWGYEAINTCNAVITFAETSGMTDSEAQNAIAEAKYLRATWYFILVQSYGDCPLSLEFINEPNTEATRTSEAEIYDVIVQDLEDAKSVLPANAGEPGRIDGAVVRHLLAKVYLTKATNNSAAESSDYQNAYNNSMELINNSGEYGLMLLEDFANIHEPRNEHNREVIFTVERSDDPLYNDIDNYKANQSSFYFRPHYQVCTSYGGLARTIEYGRPWIRYCPTDWLLNVAFAERNDDTRYDKTFQTVWLVNDEESLTSEDYQLGDTAIWLPGYDVNKSDYPNVMDIYLPSEYFDRQLPDGTKQTVKIYPSMKKYDDIDRPSVNDASVRPFIVYKFSETYLIAAEAAMYLGLAGESRSLLNEIRTRAAYSSDRSGSEYALAVQRITNATPSMTDFDEGINFILDERSRELCGEYMRWWDLRRTKTSSGQSQLLNRIRNLTPLHPANSNIQDYHVLRPIGQNQIDLTSNDFPQNPGY